MAVDPVNNSFWYTNEYIPSNGTFNWKTRIGNFSFGPGCPVVYPSNPFPADGANTISVNVPQITWQNGTGAINSKSFSDSLY